MRLFVACLVVSATAVGAATAAGQPGGGSTAPAGAAVAKQSCSLKAARAGSKAKRARYVVVTGRCNYVASVAKLVSSRQISAVGRKPALGRGKGNRMTCRKAAKAKVSATCSGSVGRGVAFKITLKMKQKTCGGRRRALRIRMQVTGGPDCRGTGLRCSTSAFKTTSRATVHC